MTASISDWLVTGLFLGYFATCLIYLVVTTEDSSDDKT